MARKNTLNPVTKQEVFTKAEIARYEEMNKIITDCQYKAAGLAKNIAGALYAVKLGDLYRIDGYKDIYEYGEQMHGVSRGTVSESVNVFKRFGDTDTKNKLAPQWDNYAWRALTFMKNLSDDEIARLEITETLPSNDIKERARMYRDVKDLIPEDKAKTWDLAFISDLYDSKWAIEEDDEPAKETKKTKEEPKKEAQEAPSAPSTAQEIPVSTVSNDDAEVIQKARNIMGEDAFETMEAEEEGDIADACRDYLEEFTTFPKRIVNIQGMKAKEALDTIKALLDGVTAGEYEVIITA